MTGRLTPTQVEELAFVLDPSPSSIHEEDRDPERYLRFVSRKATVEALVKLGLAEGPPRLDYPVGGYRARLTDAGLDERRRIREERAEVMRTRRRSSGMGR